ncbi:MAG: hypothetical protein KDN05_11725, partial [Verrucomicrobiae bacterium]|nr:hypothetical protein [Verrucomicrobiae bacterium]
KAEGTRAKLSGIWKVLPDAVKLTAMNEWRKGLPVSLASLLQQTEGTPDHAAALAVLTRDFDSLKPKRGKAQFSSFDEFLLRTSIAPKYPSGRAPYARPVLRQVVEEVLNGWDPTKADSITDPEDGEDKPGNGILYDLGIPGSRVRELQNERPLEKLTNNHLVRHRMLILERLIDDLTAEFVTDNRPVKRVVVEVARELGKFSGMTAKEIASELNSRLKDFKGAVDHLAKHAPDLNVNGSIIRKARIAMDLGWCCPFTGERYDAYQLPELEREHIIPYASRNTNALHALVLTWPQVNRMKGKRTAMQFIEESASLPSRRVPGLERLTLFTPKQFAEFVDKLDTKGHPDDFRRKRARKALLTTMNFDDKELGFTEGALTKTSHLMKLAMRGFTSRFPGIPCDPIPGPVTAEIRKSWNLIGTLARACPEIIDPQSGDALPKNEIRGLTHMHHALDAATIALAAHYFPLQSRGRDQKGRIWQAIVKRNRTPEEKEFLHSLGIFDRYQRTRRGKDGKDRQEIDVRLRDLSKEVKEALTRSLAECRVAQHLPSDRSGAKAELTTWGIVSTDGTGEDARVTLRQWTTAVEDGLRKRTPKTAVERAGKLLGPNPKKGEGKLKAINGAIVVGENFGLALDPEPVVIPFHDVSARLAALRTAFAGKPVRILRNGMLIRINRDRFSGIWIIRSIKEDARKGPLLDLTSSHMIPSQAAGKPWSKRDVRISSALAGGLEILPRRYSGYPISS